jgi:hypothetical protein
MDVHISPGLIRRDDIEAEPREAALSGGFVKAVSTGIIGDNSAVFR